MGDQKSHLSRFRRWRLRRRMAQQARAAGLELDRWQLDVLVDYMTLRATCD